MVKCNKNNTLKANPDDNTLKAQLYESTHMEYQYFLQHPQFLTKGKIVLPDLNFEVYFRSIKMFKAYVKVLQTIVEDGNFMSNQTKSHACAVWLNDGVLNFEFKFSPCFKYIFTSTY